MIRLMPSSVRSRLAVLIVTILVGISVGADRTLASVTTSTDWAATGPYGGVPTAIAIAPSNPSIIYAAGFYAGVFRSDDGGRRWRAVNRLLHNATSLAVSPADPDTLFAGASSPTMGVFKSTDGGGSWSPTGYADTPADVVVDPRHAGTVYAASPFHGISKSRDGGRTWALIFDHRVEALAVAPADSDLLYGAASRSVVRSTDGGATWQRVLKAPTLLPIAVEIARSDARVAYVAGFQGMFRTRDGGVTWHRLHGGIADERLGVGSIAVDPHDPDDLYVAGGADNVAAVFHSSDGGTTWEDRSVDLDVVAVTTWAGRLLIDPRDPSRVLVSVFPAGLFRTRDGGATWSPSSTGLTLSNVRGVVADPADAGSVLAATEQGMFRSRDLGRSWRGPKLATESYAAAFGPSGSKYAYAGTLEGVYRSRDAGESWIPARPGYTAYDVEVSRSDPKVVFAVVASRLYRSDDSGRTWVLAGTPTDSTLGSILAVDPTDPDVVYATSADPSTCCTYYLIRTPDGGHTWDRVATRRVAAMTIDPTRPEVLTVAIACFYPCRFGDPVLFRSTDSGDSWSRMMNGLPAVGPSALALDPTDPGTVYLGASDGVFRWDHVASRWDRFGPPLDSNQITSIAVSADGATVFVGTYEAGVFVRPST